ncbi:MAG TPA: glycosyltransferase family 39 protein [Archangium sp.]|uniref:glycosyltransferase family 39 protein n=1 Tax=Archangium sp. TaxID=1872627 RepID=UPI002E2F6A67|nr:glycosyltransferase family 39 protein [Archangium sp.]HEX5750565.1 glycosyltransferase family 39 protein [Archangium sp.]
MAAHSPAWPPRPRGAVAFSGEPPLKGTGPTWRNALFWLAWATLLALALAARTADGRNVLGGGFVELVPTDSHYYIRFARLQQLAFPRFEPFDPYINHPTGASIIWPPLHTWGVALFLALGPAQPERAAAWVGPVVSLLELGLLSLLIRRGWGRGVALGTLALLALVPSAVMAGTLGTADHHVHEPTLAALCALLLGRALARRSVMLGAVTGAVLGLAPLFTTSGFVLLPGLAAALPLAALLGRDVPGPGMGRVGFAMGLGAAAVLALGVALFGEPSSLTYHGLTSFQPLLALALLSGASGVASLLERRRGGFLQLGLALPCALPLVPEGVRAFQHLLLGDPLLAVVMESIPLWKDPDFARELLGPVLLLLPVALVAAGVRLWREREVSLAPVFLVALSLTAASLLQARFTQALVGSAALLIASSLAGVPRGLRPLLRRASVAVLALVGLPLLGEAMPRPPSPEPSPIAPVRSTLLWMREHTPRPSPPWDVRVHPDWGVVAQYDMGHLLVLWAERPAVATPFSQVPVHQRANAQATAVLGASTEDEAYARARELTARYLLLTPFNALLGRPGQSLEGTVSPWLHEHAGLATGDRAASSHFRLVHDSAESRRKKPGLPYARLFEVVPGAVLRGRCGPGAPVTAVLELETARGQTLRYEPRTTTGPDGTFALRVAYPTTRDTREADVLARGLYRLDCAGGGGTALVSEQAVREGQEVEVAVDLTAR